MGGGCSDRDGGRNNRTTRNRELANNESGFIWMGWSLFEDLIVGVPGIHGRKYVAEEGGVDG